MKLPSNYEIYFWLFGIAWYFPNEAEMSLMYGYSWKYRKWFWGEAI